KFYLIDGGYANMPSFLAPYRGVRYHLSEFRRRHSSNMGYADHRELFNHTHAILRNHIKRSIGVLKRRFPILKVGNHYPIESQIRSRRHVLYSITSLELRVVTRHDWITNHR
uniref:DDE Tnp4 domain-containing protein n=1 Tax=Aegilops tauschii subsp. strangulata TaxID=200361 RepID=A0A453JNP2_AEGTS